MFKIALNRLPKRLLFAFILALIGGILLEVVFKLQYRNYDILRSGEWYVASIVLTVIFVELIYRVNVWFDRGMAWQHQPLRRLLLQTLAYWIISIFVFNGLRLALVYFFSSRQFILLTDEITVSVYILFLIIILNAVDFGIVLLREWRDSLAQAEKYKKESAEFEFEMLQAQINPHFLFNSLNTLSSLVYEDADRSAEFIRKLSDVYRHVLDSRQKELISIREELAFIRSYIFLLELRFEKKLSVKLEIDEDLLDKKIAPLSFQLLIENAVKHNVVSDKRPLKIRIYNNETHLVVENHMQLKAKKEKSNGMGLRNIASRYLALSGKEVEISTENNYFTVKIPII
ncbi:MAG: histidine kinase [Bacteroidales bacterium]|jgi:sensor histidine kinase YesM|nr:histidine kinase [Bacteroidales bacterium]